MAHLDYKFKPQAGAGGAKFVCSYGRVDHGAGLTDGFSGDG